MSTDEYSADDVRINLLEDLEERLEEGPASLALCDELDRFLAEHLELMQTEGLSDPAFDRVYQQTRTQVAAARELMHRGDWPRAGELLRSLFYWVSSQFGPDD